MSLANQLARHSRANGNPVNISIPRSGQMDGF